MPLLDSFTCEACKKERSPFDATKVISATVATKEGAKITRNVTYCGDNRGCFAKAQEILEEFEEQWHA